MTRPGQRSADVVIIGGGIMGLHIAWQLAHARVGRVLLLEKRRFGSGESGKSGAILRQHYSHATLIRMARESLFEYVDLHARTPDGIGLRRPGMLFVGPARERAALEANVRLQRQHGVDVELLDARQMRELEPRGRFEDDLLAALEKEASFVEPARALAAVAAQARAAGAELEEGVAVAAIDLDAQQRVRGVRLADGGAVATRRVVNAGGPWAAALCRQLGVELPLQAVRPEQAFFAPPAGFGVERHIWADLLNGAYWKSEASGLTRVGNLSYAQDRPVPDPDHYDEGITSDFIADCRARVACRIPAYADAVSWGGCGALYTITPDSQALVGPVSAIGGLFIVSGFSGHGFKLGPSVGHGVAALITGAAHGALDPGFFAPDRFTRGERRTSAYDFGVLG